MYQSDYVNDVPVKGQAKNSNYTNFHQFPIHFGESKLRTRRSQETETSKLLAATYCKPFWKEYRAAGINLGSRVDRTFGPLRPQALQKSIEYSRLDILYQFWMTAVVYQKRASMGAEFVRTWIKTYSNQTYDMVRRLVQADWTAKGKVFHGVSMANLIRYPANSCCCLLIIAESKKHPAQFPEVA